MSKVFTFIAFLFIGGLAYGRYSGQIATNMSSGGAAQGATAGSIATLLGPVNDAYQKRTIDWEEFQGSPYTSDEFLPAELFYRDEKVGSIFYRYNALNEEVEIKETKTQQGIRGLGRDKNIILKIMGNPMSFKTFIDKNDRISSGYLTQLVDGENIDLYKRTLVKFTEGQKAANSFVKDTPSRFSQFEEYYIQKNGVDRIDELLPKKSKIYKLTAPEKRPELKEFLKDNDLDVNDEEDLKRLILYIDRQL